MRKLAGLIAAAVVAMSLTGCSMIPGVGSQTGPQACAAVSNEMTVAMKKFGDAVSNASTDPEASAKALDQLVVDFKAARSKVTNAGVGGAMDKSVAAFEKMSALLRKGVDMNSDELNAASKEVEAALKELSSSCTKV